MPTGRTKLKKRQLNFSDVVGEATGTSAYVVSTCDPIPHPLEYTTGLKYQIKPMSSSTGNITLDILGIGAVKVFKTPTLQATTGDWVENQWYILIFDIILDGGAGGFLMTGSPNGDGPGVTPGLSEVLGVSEDAGGQQIKGLADGIDPEDAVTLSQMTAAITAAVTGLLDYRGGYNASGGAWPSTGGSGSAGAVMKGDVWVITTGGTLPTGQIVDPGDWAIAKIDTPGNTGANWDILQANVVLATSTVAGIMKLYGVTGPNTDGTMTQASILTALNLKTDATFTITPKTGSYTMDTAENTIINAGGSLIMDSTTGDLTLPNGLIATGKSFGVRGFANMVNGGSMVITGTNGTLVIPTGRTCIVEITGSATAILHNGTVVVSTWSTVDPGIAEESAQSEAEATATGAQSGSTVGLSQGRALSELGVYYMLRKFVTLAWTWTVGPIISDATANTPAWFNGSKKLVTAVVTDVLDWLGINPIAVSVSLVSTTVTLDCGSKYSRKWYTATAHSANFTLTKTNKTNIEFGIYECLVTGTVAIQLDSDDRMPDDTPGWNYSTKVLTLASGGTGLSYSLAFSKTGSYYRYTVSTKATI